MILRTWKFLLGGTSYQDLTRLFRLAKIRRVYLLHFCGLSLLSRAFEVASVAMLAPLTRSIIDQDFRFLRAQAAARPWMPTHFEGWSDLQVYFLLIGSIGLLMAASLWLARTSRVGAYRYRKDFETGVREEMFRRYLTFGKSYFDFRGAGKVQGIILHQVTRCGQIVDTGRMLFEGGSSVVAYLCMMCALSLPLTGFTLLLIPILFFALESLMAHIRGASTKLTALQQEQSLRIHEAISAIPLVQLASMQKAEQERFRRVCEKEAELSVFIEAKHSLGPPIQELLSLLFLVAITSTIFWKNGVTDTGASSYIVFFVMLRRAHGAISIFNTARLNLANLAGPIHEALDVFEDADKHYVHSGPKIFEGLRTSIRFDNLHFGYPGRPATLRGVSFAIERGRVTAIVGATGSGKSTLLNILLRFYDPPAGTVFVDGMDLLQLSVETLRDRMAVVSQDQWILNETLRTNLTYGLRRPIPDAELWDALRRASMAEMVERLPQQLETLLGDRGVQQSGGEKQRIAIARAFLRNADIIIFDEATSALDVQTESDIQKSISRTFEGVTTVVVAHRLSTVADADKIVVMENGMVVEQGTFQALLARKGAFFRYWSESMNRLERRVA